MVDWFVWVWIQDFRWLLFSNLVMSTSDLSTARSTSFEIGGIGGPHPPNKGDDLMMEEDPI